MRVQNSAADATSTPVGVSLSRRAEAARRLARRIRSTPLRLRGALEDRRLMAEQRRGVLGPAHLNWTGSSAAEHRRVWGDWDWTRRGEEWTLSPDWKAALITDVLQRWIPEGSAVLEIGPGAGRWTEPLLARARELILVDVSERPLELCRERFGAGGNVR